MLFKRVGELSRKIVREALIAIKRAGADWILTYAAADLASDLD